MNSGSENEKIEVDILAEFIEVAIHCILYNRGLYPQGVFEKRIKYNVPVQMCLHPGVCNFINNIVDSLKTLLSNGKVDKVSVVILDETTKSAVERFVLEVGQFKSSWKQSDPHLFHTEQALRGFLLKLNVTDALLFQASKDTTWTIHVHTLDSTLAAVEEQFLQKDFPWAEVDEKQQRLKNPKMIPIKSSLAGEVFDMQLYAEESNKNS